METALTTDSGKHEFSTHSAMSMLLWKAWHESRWRFAAAVILLSSLVVYAVLTSPGFLARYNAHFPDKPLPYSAYVWSGLFHYALQGCWVIATVLLAMGGVAQEKAVGSALFTLALPVSRKRVLFARWSMATAQSCVLSLGCAVLISVVSPLAGESYPILQALGFGSLMFVAGSAVLSFSILLSESFRGEFTAMVVGLSGLAAIFLSYKAHVLRGWNVFDVMSGTSVIDPRTQMLVGRVPWHGLAVCLCVALSFYAVTGLLLARSDA
jgi:ABC-type transport system involved in multi-copper enzyme maturation permease subunit